MRGTGASNPMSHVYYQAPMQRFVPYPKAVLALSSGLVGQLYAAELEVEIPDEVDVKDVIAEEHNGRGTLIFWEPISGTSRIRVQIAAPNHDLNRIAVVFSHKPGEIDPVVAADFATPSEVLYDEDGNQLTGGSFDPVRIR